MATKNGPNVFEAALDGKGFKFAIVTSRFNHFIVDRLVEGCLDTLERHGVDLGESDLIKVPGAFEIPVMAKKIASAGKHDGVIALGAVIRGATPHFDYIAGEVTKGLAQVALETATPVAYGVITADTIEQAVERAGTKAGNKGSEAAQSAIEMAGLFRLV